MALRRGQRIGVILSGAGAVAALLTAGVTLMQWQQTEITRFEVTPTTVEMGKRVSITWSTSKADTVQIEPGIGAVGELGSRSHLPQRDTVYTLTAKGLFSEKTASAEVIVQRAREAGSAAAHTSDGGGEEEEAATAAPRVQRIEFTGVESPRLLDQGALREQGILRVRAIPAGDYCSGARPAVHPRGSYRSAVSFLTTASPDDLDRCNTVPLEFVLAQPVREAVIHFYGADTPYQMNAFGRDGRRVATASQTAEPYNYKRDYEIRVAVDSPAIHRVTFGRQTALTMIRDIELVR